MGPAEFPAPILLVTTQYPPGGITARKVTKFVPGADVVGLPAEQVVTSGEPAFSADIKSTSQAPAPVVEASSIGIAMSRVNLLLLV
jgi:hypothetical protein